MIDIEKLRTLYKFGKELSLQDAQDILKTAKSTSFKKKKIILEGGSIDVNGNGLILTTKQCLLSKIQQRNKGFKVRDYNQIFNKFLNFIGM